MKQEILTRLHHHPWASQVHCHRCVGSTNDLAKALARENAPEGTVVVAAEQTAGRGRMGRSFHAPAGLGLYFSLILRPECPPEQLLHLTCAAAVAACSSVESCAGFRPQIKWTNDLVVDGHKLGGILTELSVSSKTGLVEWAVIGIGINCGHKKEDFPPELQETATSLLQITGKKFSPGLLAAHCIRAFYELRGQLLSHKADIMDTYRRDCMTLGKKVVLLRGEERRYGTALDLDSDGGLLVQFDDGTTETVQSGEISVRGLYGYA